MIKNPAIMLLAFVLTLSCTGKQYYEKPFGGMKGQVEMVTEAHHVPKVLWPKQENYNSLYYINISVYDPTGNEITSAFKDEYDYILGEAESTFDGRVCVKSVQKTEGKIRSTLNLVSDRDGVLEYDRTMNGKTERMTVRTVTRGRKSCTKVTVDGVLQSEMRYRYDKDGWPVEVMTTDYTDSTTMRDRNVYDAEHNIIEKHNVDEYGDSHVLYMEYLEFDAHGNWTKAATFDENRRPKEEIFRDIKYW